MFYFFSGECQPNHEKILSVDSSNVSPIYIVWCFTNEADGIIDMFSFRASALVW